MALGGLRVSGGELVADVIGLEGLIRDADLVVTGEGELDFSSLRGKVVGVVSALALRAGRPCLALAGQVKVGRQGLAAAGLDEAHAVADRVGLDAALADPAGQLTALAFRVAGQWSEGVR
jgi:glycerate kinase